MIRVDIHCNNKSLSNFFKLLEQGFWNEIDEDCSVRDFLCQRIHLQSEYLEKRIQILFLDGRVVDDVDTAMVKKGSILALSAAMPGILGATLRKGGFFSAMRSQISYGGQTTVSVLEQKGKMKLKLFNLVTFELGPTFLQQGIWIPTENFTTLLKSNLKKIASGCQTIVIDGQRVDFVRSMEMDWEDQEMLLKIYINHHREVETHRLDHPL